ncbi:hypothetical protein VTH82DRAFT_7567 [Thermothelomyces myriococcoides]
MLSILSAQVVVRPAHSPDMDQLAGKEDRRSAGLDDVPLGLVFANQNSQWRAWKASLLAFVVASVFAGAEAALILTLSPLHNRGNGTPIMIVGIIAAILLAAGLLPPYGEIWKRRGRVIGINWVFLGTDCLGAFFSLMALGISLPHLFGFYHGPEMR